MSVILPPELVRDFVIAGHSNLDKVKALLADHADLLNAAHDWGTFSGDTETALQGASHVGNRAIAEYLLSQGAPLHVTTAAMLNRPEQVQAYLAADPGSARAHGAHRISLLAHAVYSMNADLMQLLVDAGAEMDSRALFAPVAAGRVDIVAWLLEHGATDVSVQNFEGQTPVDVAEAAGQEEIVRLLKSIQ